MSQFTATKCDECGHIQGEANHWVKVKTWTDKNNAGMCYGVALGPIVDNSMATGDLTMADYSVHDLCGQGCAVKHIAKLLKWNLPTEVPAE